MAEAQPEKDRLEALSRWGFRLISGGAGVVLAHMAFLMTPLPYPLSSGGLAIILIQTLAGISAIIVGGFALCLRLFGLAVVEHQSTAYQPETAEDSAA